jgi:hypothetical protein
MMFQEAIRTRKFVCLPQPASRKVAPPLAFPLTRCNEEKTSQMRVRMTTGKSSRGASTEIIAKSLQLTRRGRYNTFDMDREMIAVSRKNIMKQILRENR